MSAWKNVAVLTKAKQVKGGLLARSVEGLPFLLREGMQVAFVPPVLHLPRQSVIERIEERQSGAIVHFADITSIDQAEQLQGHYCLVKTADLPQGFDRSEYDDLVGLQLYGADGTRWGVVVRVEENPAHPLLVVERSGREALVPYVEDLVVSVDAATRMLTMQLADGLLDLE